MHIALSSDPYEYRRDVKPVAFEEFVQIMKADPIPFDNIFTHARGVTARQTQGNDPYKRIFTWEYFRIGHSRVTLPINTMSALDEGGLNDYDHGTEYARILRDARIEPSRVLDLNVMFSALDAIVARHRQLLLAAGVPGPFYVKAHLEDVWRTVPFLDTNGFMNHVKKHGVPVVQDSDTLAPPGTDLETFLVLEPRREITKEGQVDDIAGLVLRVFEALGVPHKALLEDSLSLLTSMDRFKRAQSARNARNQAE